MQHRESKTEAFDRAMVYVTVVLFVFCAVFQCGCFQRPPEPGFMKSSWGPETTWEKTEVGVDIKVPGLFGEQCRAAVKTYNSAIGRPFLVDGDDIVIHENVAEPFRAYTDLRFNKWSIRHADIWLPSGLPELAWLTCAHEIGHALGLDHDLTDHFSVMYSRAAPNSALSPNDRAVLRERYGR